MTTASAARSNPARSETRTPPTSTRMGTSDAGTGAGDDGARTTRAIRTAGALRACFRVLPRRYAQCLRPPAVNSRPALNACDVSPLARHSDTRRPQVAASAMPNTLRPPRYA